MKKLLLILALCSCAALFTACGNVQDSGVSRQDPQSSQRSDTAGEPFGDNSLPERDAVSQNGDEPDLRVSEAETDIPVSDEEKEKTDNDEEQDVKLKIEVNGTELTASLAGSIAASELAEKLKAEPVTVTLDEYGGFEKVGDLPWELTRTDESTETAAGDIMLYQGDKMTIFYDSNSWRYTKLGHIDNITGEELAELFGEGSITVKLSY